MKIQIGESNLNVDVRGSGELVILHPAASRSSNDFKGLAADLVKAGYMTAAINPRGVNGSTGDTKGITMKDVASDIAGVIKALDAGPAHAIGHAFSSHAVRVLAEYWPDLVRSVVCMGVGGVVLSKVDPLWAVDYILTRNPSDRERQFATKMSFFAKSSDPSPWFDGWDPKVLPDYMLALSTIPDHELLRGGNAPMLVVQGMEDKIAPPECGRILKEKFGDRVQIVDIPGAGHQFLAEQPKRVSSAILDFLHARKNNGSGVKKEKTESLGKKISFMMENWHLRKYKDVALKFAAAMKEFDKPGKDENNVKYNLGWDSAITQHQASRKASQYAAHLLPHLKPGMRLLDCGCGPGSLTIDFAELLAPGGSVAGIDIQPRQVELARSLAEKRKVKNVTFEVGNIYKLPFADNEFDAAWLCTVIMHLERPIEALKEVYRVLKPGGVISITDGDWKSDVIYPSFRVINQFHAAIEQQFMKKGMDTIRARSNRLLLGEAGFKNNEGHAVVEYYGTPEETLAYSEFIIQLAKQHADKRVTEFRTRMIETAWRTWGKHPDAFFSRTHIQAIGRK